MKVYGPKDRIKVKLISPDKETLGFILSPLTAKQKGEVAACMSMKAGEAMQDRWEMVRLALKYSLKCIEGIEDADGNAIVLALGEDGGLTEESMDTVMNIPDMELAYTAALQLAAGATNGTILNPTTGQPFDNVEVVVNPKK
jgi:hypothetical protein